MSHIRQFRLISWAERMIIFAFLLSAVTLSLLAGMVHEAQAATSTPQAKTHHIMFKDMKHKNQATLNWLNPTVSLTFDAPEDGWIDGAKLELSAQPSGPVSASTPLLVYVNGTQPIPVHAKGRGFKFKIKLDTGIIQPRRNQIIIEYQPPKGSNCLSADHGNWYFDFEESFVTITSRAKARPLTLKQMKDRLRTPTTAPQTVNIRAAGHDKLKLEVLAAQGTALNMDHLPKFNTGTSQADLQIIMALRSQLRHYVKRTHVLDDQGPSISVTDSRNPLQIIITGDNPDELMAAASAFAQFPLPANRVSKIRPGQFHVGELFSNTKHLDPGRYELSELGGIAFGANWAPNSESVAFNVKDPSASYGHLKLELRGGPFIDPHSRIQIDLNGQSLRSVTLDQDVKTVNIEIEQGRLRGLQNELTFTPHLTPKNLHMGCAATALAPGLSVSAQSYIHINSDFITSDTDLSHFMATGEPFAQNLGKATTLILTAKTTRDKNATLKLLAHMVRANGYGWTNATITDTLENAHLQDRNLLIIGPQFDLSNPIFEYAPHNFQRAINPKFVHSPSAHRQSGYTSPAMVVLQASKQINGGIATLYKTPNGNLVGVISQTHGQYYHQAITHLLHLKIWNALEGSVALWDKNQTLMTQTALSPEPRNISNLEKFKNMWSSTTFTQPNWKLPKLDFPKMDNLSIDLPEWTRPDWSGLWNKIKPQPRENNPSSQPQMPKTRSYSQTLNLPIIAPQPLQRLDLPSALPVPRLKPEPVPAISQTGLPSNSNPQQSGHSYVKSSTHLSSIKTRLDKSIIKVTQTLDGIFTGVNPQAFDKASGYENPKFLTYVLLLIMALMGSILLFPPRAEN